jgi:hypothetical protein
MAWVAGICCAHLLGGVAVTRIRQQCACLKSVEINPLSLPELASRLAQSATTLAHANDAWTDADEADYRARQAAVYSKMDAGIARHREDFDV